MSSILNDIKDGLGGIAITDTSFDSELCIVINGALARLSSLVEGLAGAFAISDSTAQWSDFIGTDVYLTNLAKEYIRLKVKLVWDPPSGSLIDLMKAQVGEYEFLLVCYKPSNETGGDNE